MKGIFINVDSYNSEGITTIQGNNNAEIYKICISKRKVRLSLVGKTVKLGYVMAGTTKGDIIEDLNISNAEQGEITFPITNKISKKDGVYTCQLAIYGADGFLEYTATFGLTVQSNIFTKIAGEIADSKDFTYLENILDKASKLSEKLKENTSSATNANSNLESNIIEANNINSKLLENTSTATGLNKNLESNITLAEGVKETIKDLDTKNIEATSKIERLEGLNTKAEELSDNINKGLPLNSELVKNTEEAKAANTNLLEANQEATTKNTELQASLEKTKEFIEGLDGSQNIPQIRLDVDALQNGLKSNQALSYEGSSIAANNTLEGRTEGMRIGGRTLNNLLIPKKANLQGGWVLQDDNIFSVESDGNGFADIRFNDLPIKPNTNYTCYIEILENTLVGEGGISVFGFSEFGNGTSIPYNSKGLVQVKSLSSNKNGFYFGFYKNSITSGCLKLRLMLIEGNNNNTINYFEGLKSFGETEKVGDKYKISILSNNKNLFKSYEELISVKKGQQLYLSSKLTDGCTRIDIQIDNQTDITVSDIMYWREAEKVYRLSSDRNKLGISLAVNRDCNIKLTNKYLKVKEYEDIQLEEGTQSTSYESYKCDKKDILIKKPLREGDYLYEDNGQVKIYRPTKQYTFTGDENFVFYRQDENLYGVYFNLEDAKKESHTVICNNFKTITEGISSEKEECVLVGAGTGSVYILINKNKLTSQDIAGFKSWLKANPTTIVYQLATPVVEVVDGVIDIDLDTFGEKTYFNILNSLQGTLDFKVSSNIASIVQANSKAINEIYNLIDTLILPNILQNTTDIEMLKLEKLK